MLPRQQRLKNRAANNASTRAARQEDIDFLLEVPNLGLADGYGQSARSIVKMLIEICEEEHLNLRIVNKRNLCGPIDRVDELNAVRNLLINPASIGEVKVFLRYSLPITERYGAKRFVAMTMFESDIVPPAWVPALNETDLVITPTAWGVKTFSKFIKPEVITIPLPVNSMYYHQQLEETLLPGDKKFRFITVGNYFQPDRKRLIPLIKAFGERYKDKNCELYVKSSWTDRGSLSTIPIDKICAKYRNVILDTENIDTAELIRRYCSSHAALYPSLGEGYGLPHVEVALLGRPLVIADNTSLTSMSEYMPWCLKTDCKPVPANYAPQLIQNAGNWFECDINTFMDKAYTLYRLWERSPKNYNQAIVDCHRDNRLRHFISHENIKEMFRIMLLTQLRSINGHSS